MQVLALITNFVSRIGETCAAMVDPRAAAERDVMCPRCGRVTRLSDHVIWLGWVRALLIAAADEETARDGCGHCGWMPDDRHTHIRD
jgi:ribosomal protein S27AE